MKPVNSPASASPVTPGTGNPARPRSLFVFDLRELGRRAGSLREYGRVAPAPAQLGHDVIGVPEGSDVTLRLRLESVTEGVLVTGHATASVAGQCARCLDPVADELDVEICELFAYAASTTDETTGADEVYRVQGDLLDVEPVVRDAVVLALPWTPLCRADCEGLCPECGQRRAELPADHTHDAPDPRWAALAGLLTTPTENPTEPENG